MSIELVALPLHCMVRPLSRRSCAHNAFILYIYNICIQSIIFPLFMLTFWTGCSYSSRLYFCITTIQKLSGWNLINLLSWHCCYPLALVFIHCRTLVLKRGTAIIRCLLYNNVRPFVGFVYGIIQKYIRSYCPPCKARQTTCMICFVDCFYRRFWKEWRTWQAIRYLGSICKQNLCIYIWWTKEPSLRNMYVTP